MPLTHMRRHKRATIAGQRSVPANVQFYHGKKHPTADSTFVTLTDDDSISDSISTDAGSEPTLTIATAVDAPDDGASASLNKRSWPVLTLAVGADHAVTRYVMPAPLTTACKDVDRSELAQGPKLPVRPPWYEPGWQQQRPGAAVFRA